MSNIQQLLTEHLDIWTSADTAKKTGRGRSSSNADKVYGIKKLRELILELAVRGKLVPQNPNDEPASELLKRIQKEKEKLIVAGKIKQEKLLPSITEKEKLFTLPKGWAYSALGDVVQIIRGITFPASEKSKSPGKGRIACLRTTNVQDRIEWNDLLYIREKFVSREEQMLKPRDIVMSMANSRELVGKVALVDKEIHQRTSFGGFLGVLRPFLIEPHFVMALLRTPHTREELIDSASQTTNIANISLAKLRPLYFAIPPLEEQNRIVTKVNELMMLCDQMEAQHINAAELHEKIVSVFLNTLTQSNSVEEFNENWQRIVTHFGILFTTESSVDVLKQTLLQLAVMGKLVPQDPNNEPASELLKRIQTEKAKLIAEGKIKKERSLVPISDDEKSFELPKGWEWCRLQDITRLITDGKHGDCKDDLLSGYYFLSAKDIQNGNLQYEKSRQVNVDEFMEVHRRTNLEFGDICMVNTGATIGKIAIAPDHPFTSKTTFQKSVAVIKVMRTHLHNNYIVNFLISESSNLLKKSGGSAINNLLLSDLKMKIVPLPPKIEQQRIVDKIDELIWLCNKLKSKVVDASQVQKNIAEVMLKESMT